MTDRYDMVVVGGGIHGAGVAQAAACGGYTVLVLEQSALAAGTSSRSSKLIRGGLRYLEGFDLGLVFPRFRYFALFKPFYSRLLISLHKVGLRQVEG